MPIDRRALLGSALAATSTAMLPRRSRAQSNTIKIGVLNDQSGPYRDIAGMHLRQLPPSWRSRRWAAA